MGTGFDAGTAISHLSPDDTIVPNRVEGTQRVTDAFGRFRTTAGHYSEFESKQVDGNLPLVWEDTEASGAGTSSTYNSGSSATTLTVSADTAGRRIRRTYRSFNYTSGKSQFITMTGVLKASGGGAGIISRLGYYDDQNGLFFAVNGGTNQVVVRTDVSGETVDTAVAQANWNIDVLDGSGDPEKNPSGINLDMTQGQIFVIDFQWLGYGRIRYGFYFNGNLYYVHEIFNTNRGAVPYMRTPNLPITYEIENTGAGAGSTMIDGCVSITVEGAEGSNTSPAQLHYHSNAGTIINANAAGTIYAIVGLRQKAANKGIKIVLKRITMINKTADDYEWLLILNPTVANAVTWTNVANSHVQTSIGNAGNPSNSTITGGTILDGGYVKAGNAAGSISSTLERIKRLGEAYDGTKDEIYLCVRPMSANADVAGSITWSERH